MARSDPGPDASQSAAPPDWYLPNFFDAWSPPHGHA
jgi:hypothetical protein